MSVLVRGPEQDRFRNRNKIGWYFLLLSICMSTMLYGTALAQTEQTCNIDSEADEIHLCIDEASEALANVDIPESVEMDVTGTPEPPGSDRIYGGSPARNADGIVSLYLTGESSSGERLASRCTGSLISSVWVLTAAHCMYFTDTNGRVISAVSGGFAAIGDTNVFGKPRIAFSYYHVHPSYGFSAGQMANDLALIRLSRAALGASVMQIVSSDSESMRDAGIGTLVNVFGFGKMNSNELSDVLLTGALRTSRDLRSYRTVFTTATTNDAGAPSTLCPGDSGGPATIRSITGQLVLVGVSSFIFNSTGGDIYCGRENNKSAFVDIIQYLPWIEEVTSR